MKEKLLNKIKIINNCWEWQGGLNNAGYGKIRNGKKHLSAHRLSYELFKGQIPEGKLVCHSCDNKKCVNPDHLWLGTQKENIQDAKKKGILPKQFGRKHSEETLKKLKLRKHSDRRGDKHHLKKLTSDDVFKIRELLDQGIKQVEIAKLYDVDSSAISNIKRKRNWSHI